MKKALYYILGLLLAPVVLFLLLAGLLMLPPVQNWAVDQVASVVSEKTGMQVTVGHVRLRFPLDLSLDDFLMVHQGDTLADVSHLVADVQLRPLLDRRVVINELALDRTRLNTNGFIDAVRIRGSFGRLSVRSRGIDLDRQTVLVNGARLEDAQVDILMRDSVPEDTTTTPTLWQIDADSLTIVRSSVALHMPADSIDIAARLGSLVARQVVADLGRPAYSVGSVDWDGGAFTYNDLSMPHVGLHTGAVSFVADSLSVPSLRLQTAESDVLVSVQMPLSFTDSVRPGRLQLALDAQLSRQDLMPFLGSLPQSVRDRWPLYPLTVKGRAEGNMQLLQLQGVDVSLPTALQLQADGFVGNLTQSSLLRADVTFKAAAQDLNFLMASLPRDVQRSYRIPAGLRAEGRVQADGATYQTDVVLRDGAGSLSLKGTLDADAMRYDATAEARALNLHRFMPRDSLYTLTARVKARGQGTDVFSPRTTLQADGHVAHLRYGGWNLDDLTLEAVLRGGRAHATVDSRNGLLTGQVGVDALVKRHGLDGTLTADVSRADLYRMGLTEAPLSIGLCGHVDIDSDLRRTHSVSGLLNDLTLRDSSRVYRPADIGLLVKTRQDTTYVRAQSGDFIVKLDASGPYDRLLRQLSVLGDSVTQKLSQRIIDQPAMRRLLPTLHLHVESKQQNPIATFLKATRGLDFKELNADLSMSPASGINGDGYLHALTVDDVRLDTVNFRLTQRRNHLSFGGQVRNNKRNPDFVFNALFDGVLQEHGATFGIRFYDGADKLGIRLGAQAEMVDSGLRLRLVPQRPTIGYKEFNLNKDNFILLGQNRRVQAKVDLIADDGTGVKVYSEGGDPTALQDLTVSVNRLDLGELTSVLPYTLPRLTGVLNGDYHVVQNAAGQLSVVSDMAVHQLTYEGSMLGNLSTELVYLQKEADASTSSADGHVVEARLMKDGTEIGLLTGTYYNGDAGRIDARLLLERTPLSLVNGMVPDQLFGLHGYGEGELSVKGTLEAPKIDGEIYLDSSYLESVPYGMTLRFDNDPVRIVDSKLLLENFVVHALNDSPLNIQGTVDFSRPEHTTVDLRMRARDFQIIGAKEQAKSIAYGRAFVNAFASVRGPADNLKMRGRVEVLGSTDMSYVLRDSPLTTDNRMKELVTFVDFGDTARVVVERPSLSGLEMDMTIDVSKGAHIMAYLNTDHSNYIDLTGGGTLRMQYSPIEHLQLRGRYTLSNGEMKYSLPVIPLKTFTIQDGSYLEFTGDVMNPTLNITAVERTKAVVAGGSGSGRSVDFDCGVRITKTLNDMGLEFTLDAPEDMQLHSELMAMGLEQRGKLAVTMLTTGMYLADGNTGAFSMNSALSSFLSSEISNITGSALRTLDMQFSMDQGMDASGATHTDYSFKFAKRFLDNRLKVAVGGRVSTGAELQQRNSSFFDNVSLEYRLDQSANKFVTLYYQNNVYDWLDGYTQKYGGGFTWRRKLQHFWDIFRLKDPTPVRRPVRPAAQADSLKTTTDEKK